MQDVKEATRAAEERTRLCQTRHSRLPARVRQRETEAEDLISHEMRDPSVMATVRSAEARHGKRVVGPRTIARVRDQDATSRAKAEERALRRIHPKRWDAEVRRGHDTVTNAPLQGVGAAVTHRPLPSASTVRRCCSCYFFVSWFDWGRIVVEQTWCGVLQERPWDRLVRAETGGGGKKTTWG